MTRTYWIVAEDAASARTRAYAVDAGRVPCLPHYRSEEAAEAWAAEINAILRTRIARVFCIHVEQRTTDDGRIPVAWAVDRVGDMAATLLIVIGGAVLVGWGTLL